MQTIQVACPQCRTILKLTPPLPTGNRVTCPTCGASFGVSAQAAPPPGTDQSQGIQARGDFRPGGSWAMPPTPYPPFQQGPPPARSNALLLSLIIGGALLVMGVGAGVVAFALSGKGEDTAKVEKDPVPGADQNRADRQTKENRERVPERPPVVEVPKPPVNPPRTEPVPQPVAPVRPEPPPPPKPEPRPTPPVRPTRPAEVITYRFQDSLAAEEEGMPALIPTNPLGQNGFETTTVFGRRQRVYRFAGNASPGDQQAGLTFDNRRGLLTNNHYSVEMVFEFHQQDNAWRRIMDVQDRQSDNGFYVDPTNRLDVYAFPGTGAFFTNRVFHHVVLTTARTGTVKAYLDGTLQVTVTTDVMNINNPRRLVHFFLDNTAGAGQWEFSNGRIALLRLYNRVLTDREAADLASALGAGRDSPRRNEPLVNRTVLADPGSLLAYQGQIGKTFYFRVTGARTGFLWGSGPYTADSSLALAAVHAGVLRPGQTRILRVRMVRGLSRYHGTTRHGVTSSSWGSYGVAFRVSRVTAGRR
jgi:hypothetical protein